MWAMCAWMRAFKWFRSGWKRCVWHREIQKSQSIVISRAIFSEISFFGRFFRISLCHMHRFQLDRNHSKALFNSHIIRVFSSSDPFTFACFLKDKFSEHEINFQGWNERKREKEWHHDVHVNESFQMVPVRSKTERVGPRNSKKPIDCHFASRISQNSLFRPVFAREMTIDWLFRFSRPQLHHFQPDRYHLKALIHAHIMVSLFFLFLFFSPLQVDHAPQTKILIKPREP